MGIGNKVGINEREKKAGGSNRQCHGVYLVCWNWYCWKLMSGQSEERSGILVSSFARNLKRKKNTVMIPVAHNLGLKVGRLPCGGMTQANGRRRNANCKKDEEEMMDGVDNKKGGGRVNGRQGNIIEKGQATKKKSRMLGNRRKKHENNEEKRIKIPQQNKKTKHPSTQKKTKKKTKVEKRVYKRTE